MKAKVTKVKNSNKSIGLIIFRIISLIIILIALYFLYKWNLENKANNNIMGEILKDISIPSVPIPLPQNETDESSEAPENEEINKEEEKESFEKETLMDFSKLLNTNSDTVAWIHVNNTDIDFPVVKTKDNDFYLKHNFNKEYNSAGWIFADYRNKFDDTDKNIIIYGHNRRNGSMFSTLNNILEENWYTNPENQYVTMYTPTKNYIYQIFSIYKINANKFDSRNEFSSDEEYQKFIEDSLNKSIYNFNITVSKDDDLLTLYTCANNTQYRIILQAKKMDK